jgi:Ion channel
MHHLLVKNNEYWTHERSLTALLIYSIVAIFTWIPLSDFRLEWWSFLIADLLFNLIVLAGIFSVITRWKKQLLFLAIALLASVLRIAAFLVPEQSILILSYVSGIAFFVMLAYRVFLHIIKDGPVNFYRIQGSIVVYMMTGIIYAYLYTIIESVAPGSFAITGPAHSYPDLFAQFLYFSFVTLTTLGYGDLIPTISIAKSLVIFQGMIGMLYPVVMIARLISLEVSTRVKG